MPAARLSSQGHGGRAQGAPATTRHRPGCRARPAPRRAASVPAAPSERAELDRITSATRAALGEATFGAAYQDGAAQMPDDITAGLDD